MIDYNFYASGSAESDVPQHSQNGTITAYDGFKTGVKDVVYGSHDVRGNAAGTNDPKFVSFPFAANPVLDFHYNMSWDFRLQAGSPALDASKVRTGFTPYFSSGGLVLNGKTHKSPAPANYFGAFGQQ